MNIHRISLITISALLAFLCVTLFPGSVAQLEAGPKRVDLSAKEAIRDAIRVPVDTIDKLEDLTVKRLLQCYVILINGNRISTIAFIEKIAPWTVMICESDDELCKVRKQLLLQSAKDLDGKLNKLTEKVFNHCLQSVSD